MNESCRIRCLFCLKGTFPKSCQQTWKGNSPAGKAPGSSYLRLKLGDSGTWDIMAPCGDPPNGIHMLLF